MSTVLDRTKPQYTTISDQHSKEHLLLTLCLLLTLIFSFRDISQGWTAGNPFPSIVNSTLLPLVPVVAFLFFNLQGCFSPKGLSRTEIAKWVGIVMIIGVFWLTVLIERMIPSRLDTNPAWPFLLTNLLLPAWVLVGFWLGAFPAQIEMFSRKLAKILAIASVIFTIAQYAEGYLGMFDWNWWPIRLTLLFAYFWFLYEIMVREGPGWYGSLIGWICTSSQVIYPLHKPIVWAAAIGTLALLLFAIIRKDLTFKRLIRLVALLSLIVVIFISINLYTEGSFIGEKMDSIISTWFHLNPEDFSGMEVTNIQDLNRILGGRVSLWQGVSYRFYESPIIGSGFYQLTILSYQTHLHNYFYDLLLGVGILGTLPIGLGLLVWFFRLFGKKRSTSPAWIVPLSAFAISVMAYGFFGNFTLFHAPSFLMPLAIGMTLRQ